MEAMVLNIKKKILSAGGWQDLAISCNVPGGIISSVFGPSGSGKTTLLRMIAGLLDPDEGSIVVGDEVWFDSVRGINLSPQKRSVGFVFQEYSLFPNMTVRENICYAFKHGRQSYDVNELMRRADLQLLAERYPVQLSGGQQQRVALVRALAGNPRVWLLDEPLSALDGATRNGLQDYILEVQRRIGITTLLVSHEISEVFKMAASVMLIKDGMVSIHGSPRDVFASYAVSGKFKFVAEVVDVVKDGFVSIFSLRIGNEIVSVLDADTAPNSILIGDRVVVASKAFNPVIMKCEV